MPEPNCSTCLDRKIIADNPPSQYDPVLHAYVSDNVARFKPCPECA